MGRPWLVALNATETLIPFISSSLYERHNIKETVSQKHLGLNKKKKKKKKKKKTNKTTKKTTTNKPKTKQNSKMLFTEAA